MTQTTVIDPAAIIEQIATLLDARYIFPEVGAQMIARLRERLPDYTAIADPGALAAAITADLQGISRDKHLHMDYDPTGAAHLLGADPNDREVRIDAWLDYIAKYNYGFVKLEWLPGSIGYLDLRWFPPPDSPAGDLAIASMAFLSHARAIIFDLRKNGGGTPMMIQLLMTYLFDASEIRHLNTFYTRHDDKTTHFWTQPYVPGRRLPDVDVYVLTSGNTFSGGEEFAYNLKVMERGTLVGETTGGGANPGGSHALDSQFTIFVPDGRAINPITQTNWEGVGVEPHVQVAAEDALRVAQRLALEKLIERASGDDDRAELRRALDALS